MNAEQEVFRCELVNFVNFHGAATDFFLFEAQKGGKMAIFEKNIACTPGEVHIVHKFTGPKWAVLSGFFIKKGGCGGKMGPKMVKTREYIEHLLTILCTRRFFYRWVYQGGRAKCELCEYCHFRSSHGSSRGCSPAIHRCSRSGRGVHLWIVGVFVLLSALALWQMGKFEQEK